MAGIWRFTPYLRRPFSAGDGMSGIMRRRKQERAAQRQRIGPMLVGILLLGGVRVEAAPILRRDWPSASGPAFRAWSKYLWAGPSAWAGLPHPPVTPAIQSSIW